MLKRIRSWPPEVFVAWIGFSLMLLLIVTSPRRYGYDEVDYMGSVFALNRYGFSEYFLLNLHGHAGPLYTIVQYAFQPLTSLEAPWTRLINPILFLGAARLLSTHGNVPHMGAQLLGCPFIGVSITMALTEMPAFFVICGGLLLFFQAKNKILLNWNVGLIQALAAGVCIGLAVLGRQTYAVIIPIFLVLISDRRQLVAFGCLVGGAVAVFGPVFWVWGGYLPPIPGKGTIGFAWDFAALGFAYTGFATLFMAPRFLYMPWKWLVTIAVVTTVINGLFHFVAYAPGIGLVSRLFSMGIKPTWIFLCSTPLIILAGVTLVSFLRAGWRFRTDRTYLFYLCATGLIILECAKMTVTFSSRYIVCALPFYLFVLLPYFDTGKAKACRFAGAAALNIVFPLAYWYL